MVTLWPIDRPRSYGFKITWASVAACVDVKFHCVCSMAFRLISAQVATKNPSSASSSVSRSKVTGARCDLCGNQPVS